VLVAFKKTPFGTGSGELDALIVCARVLGVYGWVLTALRLSFSGTVVCEAFLNGDLNGRARALVALLSLRRFVACGEDMFV